MGQQIPHTPYMEMWPVDKMVGLVQISVICSISIKNVAYLLFCNYCITLNTIVCLK